MNIQDGLFDAPAVTPRALTVRQPWASLIVAGLKDVENRGRQTAYRGTLLVHAGLGVSEEGMREHGHLLAGYPAGAVIGTVDVVGCVRDSASPWAIEGQWHWILANPRTCEPVLASGALSLWKPSAALWERVSATLAG